MLKKNRISTVRADPFRLGDWLVDPATGTLSRKNETVHLAPKLTEVLLLLVNNEGELVSKEEIITSIWPDTYVAETALSRSISELRSALGDNPTKSLYIETIPKRGYRLRASVSRHQQKQSKSVKIVAFIGLTMLAIAGFLFFFAGELWDKETVSAKQSVIVMPFEKIGAKPIADMLTIGTVGNIIECLSRIRGLKVISATSLTQFKNDPRDIQKIVESTGVRIILDGKFLINPKDTSVLVRLFNAAEQETMWTKVFSIDSDKTCSEVASKISQQVASVLNLELSPSAVTQMTQDMTSQGFEAHQYCLVADHFREPENHPLFKKAEDYYKQALLINPSYAPAYAGLAQTYMGLDNWGEHNNNSQKAQDAVMKALALDNKIPESHIVNGMFLRLYKKDYQAAESAFQEAIRINPYHYNARLEYGLLLMRSLGRLDEALFQFHESHSLNPLGLRGYTHLVELYCIKDDYDKAMDYATKAYDSYPMYPITSRNVALVFLLMGENELAVKWAENSVNLMSLFPRGTRFDRSFQLLTILYLDEGRYDEAMEISQRLDSVDPGSVYTLANTGMVALYKSDYEEAETCFREALKLNPEGVIWPVGIRFSTLLAYVLRCRGHHDESRQYLELSLQLNQENNLVTLEKNVCPAMVIQDVLAIPLIEGEINEAHHQMALAINHGWKAIALIERNPVFKDMLKEEKFKQSRKIIDRELEMIRSSTKMEWPAWISGQFQYADRENGQF